MICATSSPFSKSNTWMFFRRISVIKQNSNSWFCRVKNCPHKNMVIRICTIRIILAKIDLKTDVDFWCLRVFSCGGGSEDPTGNQSSLDNLIGDGDHIFTWTIIHVTKSRNSALCLWFLEDACGRGSPGDKALWDQLCRFTNLYRIFISETDSSKAVFRIRFILIWIRIRPKFGKIATFFSMKNIFLRNMICFVIYGVNICQ